MAAFADAISDNDGIAHHAAVNANLFVERIEPQICVLAGQRSVSELLRSRIEFGAQFADRRLVQPQSVRNRLLAYI